MLLTAVWGTFLVGAVVAGTVVRRLAVWTLVPPVALLLAMAGLARTRSERDG